MFFTIFKIGLSALVIAFASWLSGKKPELAGFIVALPILTLLVLPFSYVEYQNAENAVRFAKAIFVGVPLSMTFFLPFLLADKLSFGFWGLYVSGVICIIGAYFAHKAIMNYL